MEPAQGTVKVIYTIYTNVLKVEERIEVLETIKIGKGDEVQQETRSLGWFILLDGSRELICLGPEKPSIAVGDRIKVTFERVG